MISVAITGSSGILAAHLISRLLASGEVDRVVAIDRVPIQSRDPRVEQVVGDIRDLDLRRVVDGIDVLVHLAFVAELDHIGEVQQRANQEMMQRILEAAVGVSHLVVLSSATIYGAWPNSPTPITEAALIRPNPGFAYAVQKAELERILSAWRGENPSKSVSILRPTVSVAVGESSWLGSHLLAASIMWVGDEDPNWQFLDQADLITAIETAIYGRIDGAYNVAPDGYLSSEQRRALLGVRPRVRVPEVVAEMVARWRSRPLPEGIVPYTMHSWVISNSRLRAQGWVPYTTNEEAFVDVDPAPPWASMNAKQKQYLSLFGLGAIMATAGLGVVWLVMRNLRSRRAPTTRWGATRLVLRRRGR